MNNDNAECPRPQKVETSAYTEIGGNVEQLNITPSQIYGDDSVNDDQSLENGIPDGHTQPMSDPVNAQPTLQRKISGLSETGSLVAEAGPNDANIEMQYILMSSGSSSSSFSRSISGTERYCASCRMLMQTMKCDATKQFWRDIAEEGPDCGKQCHFKFFGKFMERLKDKFTEEEGLKSKETINFLKRLFCVDLKDETAGVQLAKGKRLTELFGPIKEEDNKCVFVNQLHQLIKRSCKKRDSHRNIKTSWFVGEMSRDDTEQFLLADNCRNNTYLIRISGTDGGDGDFVLSVKHNGHCHHIKIQGNPEKALAETPYYAHLTFAGQEFASLPDVVDYIVSKRDIDLDIEDEELEECKFVTCLRVFPNSPLNHVMSGYEKTKGKR